MTKCAGTEGRAIAAIDRALTSIERDKAAMRRVGQWMTAKFGERLLAETATTMWFLWTAADGRVLVYEGPDYGCVDYLQIRDDREPDVMFFADRDRALRHAGGEQERHSTPGLKVQACSSMAEFRAFMEQQRDRLATERGDVP